MKRTVLFTVLYLTLALGMAWANTIQGTTNPNAFTQDSINWCQFGCTDAFVGHTSPQPWVSNNRATGTIAGVHLGGFEGFYSADEGPLLGHNWVGNFPGGMGVIYNGFVFPPMVQAGIRISFDTPVQGVGAYIDGTELGLFGATITLFGQNGNPLGSFTADGVTNTQQGTALFIGAFGVGPIFAAQFDATDAGHDDFAIGTLKFDSRAVRGATPEPSSLLLFGSSAFGLAGVIRRKLTR